jgi:hypothetical protein
MVMVVFTLSRCTVCPFPPWTHLNFSVIIIQRLYLCSALVLGGSTHYLELYWLVKTLLSGLLMVYFLPCHVMLRGPSLHWPTSMSLLWLYRGYICVPDWCWGVAPITWDVISCKNPLSWLLMVVFTLSHCATWPFPPWTHLNFSVMIIQRLYLCFTLVLGGSTHYLWLCWMLETLCLQWSWLFSPCHIVVRAPSLHGPTSISLLWFYKGYICVLHWCWVVAPITCDFVGCWKPLVWAGHGGFHPVLLCYLALPSMDPPQFLC